MMTNTGREEAEKRKSIMVDFLRAMFKEEHAEEWNEYLEDFLDKSTSTSITQ